MTRPPLSVLAFGYAGLLPPLAGFAARLSGSVPPDAPVVSLLLLGGLLYGGLILSFLGGMWWGAACATRHGAALRPWLTLAVMPSLIALAALMAGVHAPRVAGALLAIALVASLLVDRRLVQNGMVPDWWMVLRVPLSLGLAAEMIVLGLVL
ncbi:MAG TPA: DUF3429 domain-containing protein [Sphingomonadaceae bacterium]|nr:DUF3429 domain-containing protein [Sphingomonadaceae bacterium]